MLLLIHINRTDISSYARSGATGRSLGRMELLQPQLQRAGRLSSQPSPLPSFAFLDPLSPLCFLCLLHKPFHHLQSAAAPIAVKGRVTLCLRHYCCSWKTGMVQVCCKLSDHVLGTLLKLPRLLVVTHSQQAIEQLP